MKRILLLGKNGQLGHELARSLTSLGEVIALGRQELDMSDLDAVAAAPSRYRPDIIVNAAAYTAVDKAETDRVAAHLVNAAAPAVLAAEAKEAGALLVHFSTDYVFDGGKTTPYLPNDMPCPINHYGVTKLLGEQGVAYSGCAYLILRTSWVFHPYYGHNFFRTMQRLAREREELRVVADQHGVPNDARDLADRTAEMLMQPAEVMPTGIHHLTTGRQTTWYEFALQIIASMPKAERKCQRVIPITSEEYSCPAKRPRWSVLGDG